MKSGHLASVCRHWRSVITTMPHLWSTLRVGGWTEREQVATWLQRAYPKKVVIDTQRDDQESSNAPPFAALQDALESTNQWHGLTITSFPPEILASQLGFQVAKPMNMLRTLNVVADYVHSPSFALLLDLVPTGAPLSELRLSPSFASAYFLQPPWFPVLQNLTVLIVNGRDIHEPFELLPAFTQLHTFEADHLPLPWYEPNTILPLLGTLQKLLLRASSVQWMAGREFPFLEECAILLPHHGAAVQQHRVELPSCRKLTYHGYPMTLVEYFHVPKMRAMELGSHDCKEQRVHQQLRHLCCVDGRISKLTSFHLTVQCSERALIKVLKYLGLLQELVLSTGHHSSSWRDFLESLAARLPAKDWPRWKGLDDDHGQWEQWCSSQTWHTSVLPHLKYLGIQCPKGFSQSEHFDNFPLFRHIGWTRAHLTPSLEHLKVWEGRGTTDDIVVDYISTSYLDKQPGISSKEFDSMIVRGMVTRCLMLYNPAIPLLRLHSTVLFRLLEDLKIRYNASLTSTLLHDYEIQLLILPCLQQIKRLECWNSRIPAYSLDVDLPLTSTLQSLTLYCSSSSWMLGRTFKALKELEVKRQWYKPEKQSGHEGVQVDLPVCTILKLEDFSTEYLRFLSCPNIQIFHFKRPSVRRAVNEAPFKLLSDFLYNSPCLQNLEISIFEDLGWLDSLIPFVFCDALEKGAWRDIGSVKVEVWFIGSSGDAESHTFTEPNHRKRWKEFKVVKRRSGKMVRVMASM